MLSKRKKWQIVTLGTRGWKQTQLAAEFDTAQSNVSKLLKKHRINGKVKAQLKRLHRQHTETCQHTICA